MAFNWIPLNHKMHSYDSYSFYMAIFSSCLQVVCPVPVGVTDLRPYLPQIIGHNSVNVHRIPTKLGTEIHPLRVPNFSLIGARIRVLWRILRSVRKDVEEEKN